MSKEPRKKDFKIGQLHGKLQAKNTESEAHIQRTVFLSQRLKLWRAKNDSPVIRIFGYEIPLSTGCSRGKCVDLMGYDSEHSLYLIELKDENSNEKTEKIAKQINDYEDIVGNILPDIIDDFEKEFFFRISFNKKIKKIVLAPLKFYETKKINGEVLIDRKTIEYAYFEDKSIYEHEPKDIINIHLWKK